MMRLSAMCLVTFVGAAAMADSAGRIYGKITTTDGDQFRGLIRWDRNEAGWVDQLNGQKVIPRENLKSADRERTSRDRRRTRVRIFGIELGDRDFNFEGGDISAESAIRFGHIRKLIPGRDDDVQLILKSGDTATMTNGSTDFGSDMRELIIEDEKEGETELGWEDIKEVEFLPSPTNATSEFGERMYGTLTTRRGEEFTGFVTWDLDECLANDVIDGEEHGRSRKIKFGKIASIGRYSASGSQITLTGGEEIVLKGTNDVDNSNRGIAISDPALGEVVVDWHEFDKLVLKPAPKSVPYGDFDGGRPLRGTVETEDGDTIRGEIRWDEDETRTWEMLDGNVRDVRYRVEFSMIHKIERDSYRGAIVTLWDGRKIELRGSNDVDDSNKGISIIQPGKKDVYVEWDNFRSVEFTK